MNYPSDSVSRCRELIAVAVSQIDGDPIVGDRLVNAALEITVAHFKKIIALQRAGRRNPMTHENANDLTANILVGRSVKHRSIAEIFSPFGPQVQFASFTFFAGLGSVQRTARGHPNASTAKNNVKDTGKLAKGKVRSKARPIPTTTASPTTTIKT